MRKQMLWLIALILVPGTVAYASPDGFNAGLSINLPGFGFRAGPAGVGINIGLPWVVATEPGYAYQEPDYAYQQPDYAYEQSDYAYQPVVTEEPPEFVMPPELGFYVAVGVPYDLFFLNNAYYFCRDNIWYNSPYYNGPWSRIYYNSIPYALNRFPFERIRHYRDNYYQRYQRYGGWEGNRHFRPGRHGNTADIRNNHDRNRYDSGRAYSQGQGYGNRPAFNRPNDDRQVNRSGQTYSRPFNRDRDYGNSRAVTRPYNNGQANVGRPAYARPNRADQRSVNRAANISPFSFATGSGNRPAYNQTNRAGKFYGNGSSYGRSNGSGQGYGNRAVYNRTNYGGQAAVGRHVYTQPNSPSQRSIGNGFRQGSNRYGNVNRGWQGQNR